MTDPLTTISTRVTPQSEQADPKQSLNSAGGYTFVASDLQRLRRFLAIGVEGGTFYATQQESTIESSDLVLRLVAEQGHEVLATVIEMSESGATVKQNPLMFTMAALAGAPDVTVRSATMTALPRVARTASHLFLFASYVENFRGWGKALRRGISNWYTGMDIDRLAYQIEKYQRRNGWSHRDLLLLAHVDAPDRAALMAHAAGKPVDAEALPLVSQQAIALAAAETPKDTIAIIEGARSVSWEMVKSEHLGDADVWRALITNRHVPVGALLRNLPRLTMNGVLDPFASDPTAQQVLNTLTDEQVLAKGRVHPMSVLLAASTYASGRSLRGSGEWRPVAKVNTALDEAFPKAFGAITPEPDTSVVLGVDVSGSMDTYQVAGLPLSCRTAAAALAQALAAQFPTHLGLAFTSDRGTGWGRDNKVVPFDVSPSRRLVDVIRDAQGFEFGGTDCALPILHAMEHNLRVDCFFILTDNETWAGDIHPHQALVQYREKTGIPARMVTVAMQNNARTIADPNDPLMLDVVGLDSNVVSLVADFAAGRV